jgi:(p)ppGpp synthase/HD superfamily hydrolase
MDLFLKLDKIREKTIELHGNQKYGYLPYEVHLISVVNVLYRYMNLNDINFNLFASAWLHDVLEDTNISKKEFVNIFGLEIYDIVFALTDEDGENYDEKKEYMYKKLINNQKAIIVKLADRIANIEYSLINYNRNKLFKYQGQNNRLNEVLKNNIHTNEGKLLLVILNRLVKNLII